VDKKLKNIRPYTVCAVVRGLKITPDIISQMIQLQEKVSITYGRNRKEVAIGIYDFNKIKSPITFTAVGPKGIKFVPLEFKDELTPEEILEKHPKGREYRHLLEGLKEYPIFIDADGEVLSMPPIINSDYTGKVTEETKDVFIECSGFDLKFLLPALNVIVAALAERRGEIQSVKIEYPDGIKITPDMKPKKMKIDINYANKISGLNLKAEKICELLEQARYDAVVKGKNIEVLYPAYRQDIMHQRDVLEDIVISYGYNKIESMPVKIATVGGICEAEEFSDSITEILVGLGLQEIMSYTLTNKKHLFEKMNIHEEKIVEISNPVSINWSVFRSWLLPSLMEFLSNNRHREFPQKIFEIGTCVVLDEKQETKTRDDKKLAVAISNSLVSYEEIISAVDALLRNIGIKYRLKRTEHSSFIEGRTAHIIINEKTAGIVGEINPLALEHWGLENPVVALELDLGMLKK